MIFLNLETVIEINRRSVLEFGGVFGIRDQNILHSAIANPRNLHFYRKSEIFEVAASYAFSIIKNHAFIDGNKRTGFASMVIFLNKNNLFLSFDIEESVEMMVKIACSEVGLFEVVNWIKNQILCTRQYY